MDTKFTELINQLKENMIDINTFIKDNDVFIEGNDYIDAINETVNRISELLEAKPSVVSSTVSQPIESINIDHLLEAYRNGEFEK